MDQTIDHNKTDDFLDVLLSEFELSDREKHVFRVVYKQGFHDGYFAKEHELKIKNGS